MKIFKLLMVLMAASMLPFGCSKEENSLKSITGTVTDSKTGRAVADATVTAGSAVAKTDNNGAYLLSGLKSGNYTLVFSKEGYKTNQQQTIIMGRDAIVDCVLEPLQGEINSISGKVTDAETGSPIQSVTVSTGTLNAVTNDDGSYIIAGLKSGTYTLTFSKSEYETRELTTAIAAQSVTLNCALNSIYSSATVAIDDFIAISDGIYYYFKPSVNAKKYYWSLYKEGSLPSSDAGIIDDLLSNGVESNVTGSNKGYGYNMTENTKFTLCMVAVDANNKKGKPVKKEFSTKSSLNQPIASLTINSITGTSITYSTVKNSYCSSYVLMGALNLTSTALSYPDIVWASYCYEHYKNSQGINTQNITNNTWTGWNNDCIIITMGFSSNGVNSGVISKQYFSVGASTSAPNIVKDTSPIQKEKEMKANVSAFTICESEKKPSMQSVRKLQHRQAHDDDSPSRTRNARQPYEVDD